MNPNPKVDAIDKRIAQIKEQQNKRISQLKEQKKMILAKDRAKERTKERRERNHRLIQIGAIIEKYAGTIVDLHAFETYVKETQTIIKQKQNAQHK